MIAKYVIMFLSIILFAFQAQAQEEQNTADPEITFSSTAKIQREKLKMKNKTMTEINQMVYNDSNTPRMREYVRNSNAIKKILGEPEKNVNVEDKKALSQYMQEELGLDKIDVEQKKEEPTETKYRSKAAELLK